MKDRGALGTHQLPSTHTHLKQIEINNNNSKMKNEAAVTIRRIQMPQQWT